MIHLGAGESGKSTIAKQMKILHLSGFNDDEKLSYRSIIHNNAITSMRVLCQACINLEVKRPKPLIAASTPQDMIPRRKKRIVLPIWVSFLFLGYIDPLVSVGRCLSQEDAGE